MINSRKGSCSLRRSKSNSTQFKNLLRTNLKNSTRIQIMDRLTQIQNSIDNVCVLLLLDILVWALIHTLKLIVIMFSTHHYIVKNANFIQLNDNIPITIDNNELKDNNVINSKCILSYDRSAYLIINISS